MCKLSYALLPEWFEAWRGAAGGLLPLFSTKQLTRSLWNLHLLADPLPPLFLARWQAEALTRSIPPQHTVFVLLALDPRLPKDPLLGRHLLHSWNAQPVPRKAYYVAVQSALDKYNIPRDAVKESEIKS
jgi:hypothetical protein